MDASEELLLAQFKAVTDISTDENDELIATLLRVHDQNVNNAISTYFDSGFTSVSARVPSLSSSSPVSEETPSEDVVLPGNDSYSTSGAAFHDVDDQNTTRHRGSNNNRRTSFQTVNLQHQLYYDSFMPKLPRAPKLSNHWQLEFSLYTSRKAAELQEQKQREEELKKETDGDDLTVYEETKSEIESETKSEQKNSKARPLWILLLIIPQGILNAIISIAQFLLSPFLSTSGLSKFRRTLPKLFDYEHLQMDYLHRLSPAAFETAQSKLHVVDKHYNETFEKVMKEYKWLLVILLASDKSDDTSNSSEPSFTSKFLTHPQVPTIFTKENSTIFVGSIDGSPECLELAQTYQVKKLPYIMLCANINNIPSIVFKCNLAPVFVTPQTMSSTIDKIVRNLLKQSENYTPQLISDRFEYLEMEQSRQIRQSQDDAYLQSLERDRQRKIERENIQWLDTIKSRFLRYHLAYPDNTSEEDGRPLRFAIKLPSGKRLVDKFPPTTTVAQLYLHIEQQLYVAGVVENGDFESEEAFYDSLDTEKPDVPTKKDGTEFTLVDYESSFPWQFEVVQPFPKVVVPPSWKQISEVKELKSGANLLIEYADEADSLEED